jgi:hypothetical protein
MYDILKKLVLIFTIAAFLSVPLASQAFAGTDAKESRSDAGAMVADFLLVRPLGFVTLVAGFTCFVLSSPFSALGGNINTAWDRLAADPAKFTFARPLGEF